jgi:hypothetical protein
MADPNAPPQPPPPGQPPPPPPPPADPTAPAEQIPPEEIADELPDEPAPEDAVEAPEDVPEDVPPPPAKKAALPYKGRVTFPAAPYVQVLAVRSGPGTNYPIIARLPDGSVVTVVKEQGNWGSFKKGGWSSLTYVKKV